MSTCKDCLHYDACGGFTPTDLDADVFDYCRKGNTDEIPDIEERCGSFKNKTDYVEVKHGHWKQNPHCKRIYFCSECGRHIEDGSNTPTEFFPYCNCGQKIGYGSDTE